MEQLWAPWRLAYVVKDKQDKPAGPPPGDPDGPENCFICRGLSETRDRENLILQRTDLAVVILNRFPYNNGHLLVAPRRHVGQLGDMTHEELLELQLQLREMCSRIQKTMSPDGFNIGLNLGRSAGAGLPGHLHWHIVPRWNGDTNFMPVLTDVKVIVQSLDALWDLLHSAKN